MPVIYNSPSVRTTTDTPTPPAPSTPAGSPTSNTAGGSSSATVLPTKSLGENDFLKLLVAQMTSQDPMNPQSGTDFVTQLAQFTNLQQTQTMASSLTGLQGTQQFLQANSLLGTQVTVQTASNTTVTGTVTSVTMQAGTPQVIVDGQAYNVAQVVSVTHK